MKANMLKKTKYVELEADCRMLWKNEDLDMAFRLKALLACYEMVGHWPKSIVIEEAIDFVKLPEFKDADKYDQQANGVFFDRILTHYSKKQLSLFRDKFIGL